MLVYDQIFRILVNALLLLLSVKMSRVIHGGVVTPLTVYAVSWVGTSTVNALALNEEAILHESGWLIIWSAFVAFVMGYIAFLAFRPSRSLSASDSRRARFDSVLGGSANSIGYQRSVWLLLFLCSAATAINAARVLRIIGLRGLLTAGRAYELVFAQYTPLNYVYFLSLAVIGLAVVGGYYAREARVRDAMRLACFLALCETVLIGHKITFLIGLLILAFCSGLLRTTVSRRLIIGVFGGVVGIFVLVSILRNGGSSGGTWDRLVANIAAYVDYNFKNLENFARINRIVDFDPHGGSHMLQILSRLGSILSGSLQGVTPGSAEGAFPDWLANPAYNLATYLVDFIARFSYFGVFLGPFLIGFGSHWAFDRLTFKPSVFLFFFNVVLFLMLAFTFSSFEFLRPQFLFLIGVFWLVQRSVKGRYRHDSVAW